MTDAIPAAIPRAALVTGGAQRIGRAIALALAGAGFDVARALQCQPDCLRGYLRRGSRRSAGARCCLQADLADETQTAALLPHAAAALGAIGVLVNNASLFERDEWHDTTRASWDAHLEPNLRAPFVLMQHFARALPETAEGVVINLLDQRVWSITPHFRILHAVQGRAVGADPEHGAGAGAAHPGERHRPGPGTAQPAADARSSSTARPVSVPLRHGHQPGGDRAAPRWPSWRCRR